MKNNQITDDSSVETCLAIACIQLKEIQEQISKKGSKNITIAAIDALKNIRTDLNDICTWILSEKYKKTDNSDTCTRRLAEKYKEIHNPEHTKEINTIDDHINELHKFVDFLTTAVKHKQLSVEKAFILLTEEIKRSLIKYGNVYLKNS